MDINIKPYRLLVEMSFIPAIIVVFFLKYTKASGDSSNDLHSIPLHLVQLPTITIPNGFCRFHLSLVKTFKIGDTEQTVMFTLIVPVHNIAATTPYVGYMRSREIDNAVFMSRVFFNFKTRQWRSINSAFWEGKEIEVVPGSTFKNLFNEVVHKNPTTISQMMSIPEISRNFCNEIIKGAKRYYAQLEDSLNKMVSAKFRQDSMGFEAKIPYPKWDHRRIAKMNAGKFRSAEIKPIQKAQRFNHHHHLMGDLAEQLMKNKEETTEFNMRRRSPSICLLQYRDENGTLHRVGYENGEFHKILMPKEKQD